MADKELIRQLINHFIYDRPEEAEKTFHEISTQTMKELAGIGTIETPTQTVETPPPENNEEAGGTE